MRRSWVLGVIGLWICWQGAQGGEALTTHPDSSTWQPLFTTNLSNATAPAGVWSWKNGELSPKGKDEAIWTKEQYGDFILDLEFKLEAAGNSGVLIYCTNTRNWIPNTVEIQIQDDAAAKWATMAPTWRCGGVFGHSAPRKAAVKKAGEWNRMTIRCQGPMISVLLNGELVTDINMKDWKSGSKNPDGSAIPGWMPRPLAEMATKGFIGFQGEHGGVPTHYRNIRIKAISNKETP